MANFYPPGFENKKKSIAIDFDGVLHDAYQGWGDGTCYGDPLPGAIEAIKQLSQQYQIVIFTAKAKPDRPLVDGKTGVDLVKEWFVKYNILDYITEVTSEKPRAELYIDDNGYRFENWDDTLKFVENGL
jgi:5'(3')-deoxyribonucleotidase